MPHFGIGDTVTIHGPFGEWTGEVRVIDRAADWMEVLLPDGTQVGTTYTAYVMGDAQPKRMA